MYTISKLSLSTRQKIGMARTLSATLLFFRTLFGLSAQVISTRRGIIWALNLREGIDFAIYLLGGFELRTLKKYTEVIREGDVVFDIGANIGAHTLPLAASVGDSGRVYSFEPTTYAFGKQRENIALNPRLACRIVTNHVMLIGTRFDLMPNAVYSSWPLESALDLHAEHRGRLMATEGAVKMTLDSFIHSVGISRVNLIKLDVDGNEYDVLLGARKLLGSQRPQIVLELAPYVDVIHPEKFDTLLRNLWAYGYQLFELSSGRLLPQDVALLRSVIPSGGALNVFAKPR